MSPTRHFIARKHLIRDEITSGLRIVGEGVAELLWPTRCVLCDVPGTLLCDECRREIPYIDPLKACSRCGQAYGKFVCIDCNSFIVKYRACDHSISAVQDTDAGRDNLGWEGFTDWNVLEQQKGLGCDGHAGWERTESQDENLNVTAGFPHPLDKVVSVFELVDPCRKLITTYKDRKEVRLAGVLAELLCAYIDPVWIAPSPSSSLAWDTAIVAIPAREEAIRERGFDHMKLVGERLSELCGLPLLDLLATSESGDQRGLSARGRQRNMCESFVPKWSALDKKLSVSRESWLALDEKRPVPRSLEAQEVSGNVQVEELSKNVRKNLAISMIGEDHEGSEMQELVGERGLPIARSTQGLPARVILIDDVITTGATLVAAAEVLKEMGVDQVVGLTVARLP